MDESDAFFNSCRTRALHDFNDVLEQSLELSKDVLDALVENQLISNHVKDMLSGVRIWFSTESSSWFNKNLSLWINCMYM